MSGTIKFDGDAPFEFSRIAQSASAVSAGNVVVVTFKFLPDHGSEQVPVRVRMIGRVASDLAQELGAEGMKAEAAGKRRGG